MPLIGHKRFLSLESRYLVEVLSKEEGLVVLKIKTLLMAAAIATGAVLAMPAAGQAMPASTPLSVATAQPENLFQVYYHKHHHGNWDNYHHHSWNNYHHHHRWYGYHHYDPYYYPYYGYYEPYPYYGYYGPRYYYPPRYYGYGPGIGFSFHF